MPKKKNTTRSDGRIAVQVYIGRDPQTQKRRYKTVYGATQKEADAKALDVKISLNKGLDVSVDHDAFKTWADRWVAMKKADVSYGMMLTYTSCLEHLKPIWYIPIKKVRTADIQDIITALAKNNPNTDKPAAKRTLTCIRLTAQQVFQMAIDNRVFDYNPASAVKIPASAPTKTKRALTEEEQQWIIDTPHDAQLPAMIMLFAGLRRGEVLALTWSDIKLDDKLIVVNKAVEMVKGKAVCKPMTKTAAGMRSVHIPQILADFLSTQPHKALLVCPNKKGEYRSATSWKRLWNSYLADLNIKYGDFSNCVRDRIPRSKFDPAGVSMVIPKFTAHWLRHTFATMMYFAGVDIMTTKEQLGHADVHTTMEIYTHLDSVHKQRSVEKLDTYLQDSRKEQKSAK